MTVSTGDEHPPSTSLVRTTNRCLPAVSAFAVTLSATAEQVCSPLTEHIKTMSVIETAYQSVRTGQPESPARLFRAATGSSLEDHPLRAV